MKKLILLALALPSIALAYTQTSQQDCTPLDLRNSQTGAVRNQKDMAWCYAFTGSDILNYAYELPERVSAADVAIGYNETKLGLLVRWFNLNLINRKDPIISKLAHQTGFNKFSMEHALKDGWCPESVFPSEDWVKVTASGEQKVPLEQAMIEISALHDVRKSLRADQLPYYYKFKNVDAHKFVDMLQTKNVAGFYSSLRQTVCKDDRHSFDSKWKVNMVIKNPKIFQRVSEQLETGRLVGLDYDSHVLQNSANQSVKLAELHTSSIVGRRWNAGKNSCEFLIRNSHGDKCGDKYDQSYECDAGNVWIGESTIYSNLISIVYMLSPGK